ncbi:MAG: hypothetical protein IJG68_04580 [Bacilli bacterium]|nr:hypothetical protein [Bacilli bacterium]
MKKILISTLLLIFFVPFGVNAESIKLIDYIEKIAKDNNANLDSVESIGDTGLAYDGTINNNLRYIGSDPNNYVLFNDEHSEPRNQLQVFFDGDISTNLVRFLNTPFDSESKCLSSLNSLSYLGNDFQIECKKNADDQYYIYGHGFVNSFGNHISEEDCILSVKGGGFYKKDGSLPNSIKCLPNGKTQNVGGWRIIGVFNNVLDSETQTKKVKIIRYEPIGKYSWDVSPSSINNGYGINEWSQADIMKLLNPGFHDEAKNGSLYWDRKSGNCFSWSEDSVINCDFSNIGIKDQYKDYISNAVYKMGNNQNNIATWLSSFYNVYDYYNMENGETYHSCNDSSNKSCTDSVTRNNTWNGYITLPYSSDIGFATSGENGNREVCLKNYNFFATNSNNGWNTHNECVQNDWMFMFGKSINLLNSINFNTNSTYISSTSGGRMSIISANTQNEIYPTLYLNPELYIIEGDGTSDNPYVLSDVKKSSITTVNDSNCGNIFIRTNMASYKDSISFTLEILEGYVLDAIKIIDMDGNIINYKKIGENEYEFTMPDSDVTISPTYKKIESVNVPDTLKNPNTGYKLLVTVLIMIITLSIVTFVYKKKESSKI